MTIALEESLASLKERIGWDDSNYAELALRNFDYRNPNLPILVSASCTISNLDAEVDAFHMLERFYVDLEQLRQYTKPDVGRIRREMIPFISEILSNILYHGGDGARSNPTLIQHYIPENSGQFVMRFSNEHANPWNPAEIVEQGGRGGFSAYRYEVRVVTFENEGRDLVALILLK